MSNSGEVETQAPPSETPKVVVEGEAPVTEMAEVKEEKKPKRERKQKVVKEVKEKKKPKAPSHPPYFQMIKEAITALNEKGGSSPYAIAKYMEQNHKAVLPSNFRKILGLQLKNSVSKNKLVKIKASYKLTDAGKKREKPSAAAITTRAARANAAKEPAKRKRPKSKAVSKIESFPVTPTARRSKRSMTARKVKSIKPPVAKKAKKGTA